MSNLLTTGEIYSAKTFLSDHFDTFARSIVVNKPPRTTIVNTNTNTAPVYPGYGVHSQSITNTILTPVSGIFSGMLIYEKDQKISYLNEPRVPMSQGKVKLKVRGDAYNYIKMGKTDSVVVDGMMFNVGSDEAVQNFLGDNYYYFTLLQTQ